MAALLCCPAHSALRVAVVNVRLAPGPLCWFSKCHTHCEQHTAVVLLKSHTVGLQVGLLPVIFELVPLLKPHDSAWLTYYCVLSSPIYQSAAHYGYAHTLLVPGPLTEQLLGIKFPWGSIWHHDMVMQRSDELLCFDGRLTPESVCAWLRAVAALATFPPQRALESVTYKHPLTLEAWWRLVELVAARVPPHWLAAAVLPLSGASPSGRAVTVRRVDCKGTAAPPLPSVAQWPIPSADDTQWDFGVAAAELDVLAAMHAHRLPPRSLRPASMPPEKLARPATSCSSRCLCRRRATH